MERGRQLEALLAAEREQAQASSVREAALRAQARCVFV